MWTFKCRLNDITSSFFIYLLDWYSAGSKAWASQLLSPIPDITPGSNLGRLERGAKESWKYKSQGKLLGFQELDRLSQLPETSPSRMQGTWNNSKPKKFWFIPLQAWFDLKLERALALDHRPRLKVGSALYQPKVWWSLSPICSKAHRLFWKPD